MTAKETIVALKKLPVAQQARALEQIISNLADIAEREAMISWEDIETVCETILKSEKTA